MRKAMISLITFSAMFLPLFVPFAMGYRGSSFNELATEVAVACCWVLFGYMIGAYFNHANGTS